MKTKELNITEEVKTKNVNGVTWNPWLGVFLVLVLYFLSQAIGLVVLVYPLLRHWTQSHATSWLNNSIYAQFFYVLIIEAVIVGGVLLLLKIFKAQPKSIGLRKPKLSDPLYGLAAVPVYYLIYFIAVAVIGVFYTGLNVNQKQEIGFNGPHGFAQLLVTFISLVILPPIAEEILVRGFLYSSLKKGLPQIAAAVLTSVIFASAHLPEGAGGLLWIGAIDTFILSLVLVYLREKTGGLWAGMTLHGIKNFLAYFIVFIAPLITFKL